MRMLQTRWRKLAIAGMLTANIALAAGLAARPLAAQTQPGGCDPEVQVCDDTDIAAKKCGVNDLGNVFCGTAGDSKLCKYGYQCTG